jgi:hypothetical protein
VPAASPTYPDDSPQSLLDTWWTTDDARDLRRGRLLWAFVPHVDQEPQTLVATGRQEPTEHHTALVRLEPLRASAPRRTQQLPVAALPNFPGEVRTVYRAKRRPVLVIAAGGPTVPRELRAGAARWQSAPTILVAPYYGGNPDGTRGGFRAEFVTRIRRCEYPQYVWDKLPLAGASESILRLDHLQPIGHHPNAYEYTSHCLSVQAVRLLDDWLTWLLTGTLPPDGDLAYVRGELAKLTSLDTP